MISPKTAFGTALLGIFLGIVPLASAGAQPADPGASEWSHGEKARVRLISTVTGVGELETMQLGLEVVLEEGWKTYWRSPGDAGVPPHIDWVGSANVASVDLAYPAPKRFSYYELETFGYKERVIYPLEIRPENVGTEISFKAAVDILICDDVCIPHSMDLSMQLPDGPARGSEFANQINQFSAKVPGDGSNSGLVFEDAVLRGTDEAPILQIAFAAEEPFVAPDLLVEGPDFVTFTRPTVQLTRDAKRILVTVSAADSFGEAKDLGITSMPLTVTLIDGDRTMEKIVTPQFGATATFNPADFGAASAASGASFLAILVMALIGGLILNLMPCVLPVLSIKFLSVVSHGGDDPRHVRAGFLATSAGIIAAFLTLALVLVGLKSFGMAVGWGIQFQQPVFVVTLILVLVLFAANMWGLFEIRLPGAVSDVAVAHSGGTSIKGQFFQGVFATVLATPCSAPFLGTAVGFALSRGAGEIISVFAALGIGMAMPFLAVAMVPKVATRLPKPGAWMLTLKKILAFVLLATAGWLVTVLGVQVSVLAAAIVTGLMVLTLISIAGRSRSNGGGSHGMARAVPAVVILLAAAAYATPSLVPVPDHIQVTEIRGNVEWVPFDRGAIPELVASGKTVFVDVTAEWCITCQVNKKRVLDTGQIAQILEIDNIVAMKADWTKPNEDIRAYLESFNRFGIPFNVVYGPTAPAGVTLPELLTDGAVLSALSQAGTSLEVANSSP